MKSGAYWIGVFNVTLGTFVLIRIDVSRGEAMALICAMISLVAGTVAVIAYFKCPSPTT